MSIIYKIACIIAIIGAINWGASAFMADQGGKNLVHLALGDKGALDTPAQWNKKELTVYIIVAIAGFVCLFGLITGQKH